MNTQEADWIYLDQFVWIELSKTLWSTETKEISHSAILPLIEMVGADRVRLPISVWHLIEAQNHSNLERRRRLSRTISELCLGWILKSASDIVPNLIHQRVMREFGHLQLEETPSPFGRGMGDFFAGGGGSNSSGPQNKLTNHPSLNAIDEIRLFIEAPYEEIRKASAARIKATADEHPKRVEEIRGQLRAYPREVRERYYCATLTELFYTLIEDSLSAIGESMSSFLALGTDRLCAFWCAIPPLHVESVLTIERNEHWDRAISANDSRDIAFLSMAIPYCDYVVTEKFWKSIIQRKKLDQQYKCTVFSSLDEFLSGLLH